MICRNTNNYRKCHGGFLMIIRGKHCQKKKDKKIDIIV
jgi:hypothetical protein